MKKIIRFLFLLISGCFFCINVNAQAGYEDVVYLKNGSVVHGIIVEQIPGISVKIETAGGDQIVFKMEEIEKITKEKKQTHGGMHRRNSQSSAAGNSTDPYTGYVLGIESHLGEGTSARESNGVEIGTHIINGIMIENKYSVGIGVGFDLFNRHSNYELYYSGYDDLSGDDFFLMTYFLDLRAHPLDKKISPLIILDVGYSLALFEEQASGGFVINGGLGAKINFSRKVGLNLTLNYKSQKVHYDNGRYYNSSTGTMIYNRGTLTLEFISLAFGITL